MTGMAVVWKTCMDGAMCRTADGGSLFQTDIALGKKAYLYALMVGIIKEVKHNSCLEALLSS